jgi:hypothetical protein
MSTRREVLIAAASAALSPPSFAGSQDESAAVYAAFFRELAPGRKHFVIRENRNAVREVPMPDDLVARLREFEFPKQPRHRAADFHAIQARLLSDREYVQIFSDSRGCAAGWKEFHSRFPKAETLVELSGVGVSSNRREAALLVHGASGCLNGSWEALFFSQDHVGAPWKFKESQNYGRS